MITQNDISLRDEATIPCATKTYSHVCNIANKAIYLCKLRYGCVNQNAQICALVHTSSHLHMHTRTHTHALSSTQTHTHTHTHTLARTHARTHKNMNDWVASQCHNVYEIYTLDVLRVQIGSPIRVKRFQTMRPPVQYYNPKLDPWIVWKPSDKIQGKIPVF